MTKKQLTDKKINRPERDPAQFPTLEEEKKEKKQHRIEGEDDIDGDYDREYR